MGLAYLIEVTTDVLQEAQDSGEEPLLVETVKER